MTAAQTVRAALDADTSLARASVRVSPEGQRLVLRGTVDDDATRRAVERAAQQAASGVTIDNQIQVTNR